MKKVLDLTHCNSTEEICDELQKEIDKNEALKNRSLFKKMSSRFKQLFHK